MEETKTLNTSQKILSEVLWKIERFVGRRYMQTEKNYDVFRSMIDSEIWNLFHKENAKLGRNRKRSDNLLTTAVRVIRSFLLIVAQQKEAFNPSLARSEDPQKLGTYYYEVM